VQLQDQNGNVATAGAGGVTVGLSADGTTVFATSSGGAQVSSVTIGSGSSTASFYFGDTAAESVKITASATGLTSAEQTETVGADQLVFTTEPFSDTASSGPTDGPVTVELENTDGTPVDAGSGGLTVDLASSSTGTYEFAATSGGTSVTSVTIPSGQSSVSFYYGDELAGTPTLTASATGVTSATQQETITAGPAAGLSFTDVMTEEGPATVTCTGTVGSDSFACTISPQSGDDLGRHMSGFVTLIDQFQNLTTSSSPVTVTLSQTGGISVETSTTPTVTIPAGSSTSSTNFDEMLEPNTTAQGTVTATATVNSASVQAQITS
jgi:hypothetical protein